MTWVIDPRHVSPERAPDLLSNSVDVEEGAYTVPVQTMVDLWVTRFGNRWVDAGTIAGDTLFTLFAVRLRKLGRLEVIYLTDRMTTVARIPE